MMGEIFIDIDPSSAGQEVKATLHMALEDPQLADATSKFMASFADR